MKKIIAFIIVITMLSAFVPTAYASTLPFTDEDYARLDFSHDEYEKYVVDSIDLNGCEWPAGTKAISWEVPTGHKSIARNKRVNVPRDIEIIGDSCFMDRDGITDDVIDFSTLTELKCIGKNAFRDTDIQNVDLSDTKVVRIGESAFYTPGISIIIAPSTLRYIGDFAFGRDCSIQYIELNEGLEYIGTQAFWAYKGKLVIPSTVKYISYNAMPNASVYVYKGSYAEQWCRDNNKSFHYVKEEKNEPIREETEEFPHITHRVGPLMVEGYYTHSVSENTFGDGTKTLFYHISAPVGVVLETAFDGVEVYYTPAWRNDGKYAAMSAMADTVSFEGSRGGKVTLSQYGVAVQPTKRLAKGWEKGVRWTFGEPQMSSSKEHALMVEYDGVIYRYKIVINWSNQYEEARRNPAYDKMGFDDGESVESRTSKLIVDGREYAAESYNFFGNNYFRLRDIAMFLKGSGKQFEVTYDNEKRAINLIKNKEYTPVGSELKAGDGKYRKGFFACPSPVYCDGIEVLMRARLIEGTNYIMLRDLGQIIDFEIIWDEAQQCIVINTNNSYR